MQVLGRLTEMAFAGRTSPSSVGLIAMGLLPRRCCLLVISGHRVNFVAFAVFTERQRL